MKTTDVPDDIKNHELTEPVWRAINIAKVRSAIYYKYGFDVIDSSIISPGLMDQMMNETIMHIADLLVESMGRRNCESKGIVQPQPILN